MPWIAWFVHERLSGVSDGWDASPTLRLRAPLEWLYRELQGEEDDAHNKRHNDAQLHFILFNQ